MEETIINNWTVFGSSCVTIELHEAGKNGDNETVYQAAIGFFLEDGSVKDDSVDDKHITILTEQFGTNKEELTLRVAKSLSFMFDNLDTKAFIFEDLEVVDEIDLQKLITEEFGAPSLVLH